MPLVIGYTSPLVPLSRKHAYRGDGSSQMELSPGAALPGWDLRVAAAGSLTEDEAGKDGQPGPVSDFSDGGPDCSDIVSPFGGPIQLAPKRKTVTQWTCCVCGHTGMSVNLPACQYCSTPRCAYCPVERVRVKAMHLTHEESGPIWAQHYGPLGESPGVDDDIDSVHVRHLLRDTSSNQLISNVHGRPYLAVLPRKRHHSAPSLSAMSGPRCLVALPHGRHSIGGRASASDRNSGIKTDQWGDESFYSLVFPFWNSGTTQEASKLGKWSLIGIISMDT